MLTHNTWNIWRVAASFQNLSYLLRLVRTDRRLISCSYPNSNMNATAGSSYLNTHSPRPWLRNTTANYGPLLSLCSMGKWDVFFGQTNYFRSDSADGVDKIVSFVLYCLCVQNKLCIVILGRYLLAVTSRRKYILISRERKRIILAINRARVWAMSDGWMN